MLIAALALVALPGLAGSRVPSPLEPLPASAFQPLSVSANPVRSAISIGSLDAGDAAAGSVAEDASFIEPGSAPQTGPTARVRLNQPESGAAFVRKPPRYTLTGGATFYDNGTTAMRLPRGTRRHLRRRRLHRAGRQRLRPDQDVRVVDLYRPDFFDLWLRRGLVQPGDGIRRYDGLRLLTAADPARYPCPDPSATAP